MANKEQTTVIVGMSGGVDSSVSAFLLKKEGYKVIGLFMKNWDEVDEKGVCTASRDFEDVVSVCEQLDIPYYSIEFIEEYRKLVFDDFVSDFKKGYTPNPDVLCNREIKFKVFWEKAKQLGADYLATGHYCNNPVVNNRTFLAKGNDSEKDQSYFLYMIKEDVLKNVIFPIGQLEKSEIRQIAKDQKFSTKDKKDSTGICFIGERNFKGFLENYIKPKSGNLVNLEGLIVGEHSGVYFYTIGQRKGLGLGGPGEPWYVVGKNIEKNEVIVERGEKHPALYADNLIATEITWICENVDLQSLPLTCKAKIRYRQIDQECFVERFDDKSLMVSFKKPQRAITIGQSVVFYKNNYCLGGGIIKEVGSNYFEQKKILP